MFSRLQQTWKTAAKDLQLDIISPFELILPSGKQVNAQVLVRNFGAIKGMLVDPAGNPVARKSPGNHTPIDFDL